MIKVGDKVKLIKYEDNSNPWELHVWGAVLGGIYTVEKINSKRSIVIYTGDYFIYTDPSRVEVVSEGMPNREFLAEFIKLNNIKKTRVSLYLGMAENWLTTMINEKRATRKDISDATLQDIMRKLHIDWTSQEFVNVKATKSSTAYKTKPCNYSRAVDKERLQKAMWNGELVA